jgi:ABC-2 type transport system ATP-binding protein
MWEIIQDLAKNGTTILLTTQNMEEADKLADRIIVIDKGKIIAEGTPDKLKSMVGSARIVVTATKDFQCAVDALGDSVQQQDKRTCTISVKADGIRSLMPLLEKLSKEGTEIESISLRQPTLDDVFLSLTGHTAEAANGGVQNGK